MLQKIHAKQNQTQIVHKSYNLCALQAEIKKANRSVKNVMSPLLMLDDDKRKCVY